MSVSTRATIDDLHRVEGKAELIGGRIVHLMGAEFRPSLIAANMHINLFAYASTLGRGWALINNVIFAVPELTSGRESFSRDSSYHLGLPPSNEMDAISGAPIFAIQVRSKGDYGKAAELEITAKRADDFEAETEFVWDVDFKASVVRSYLKEKPDQPILFGSGQDAEASPALPGWRLAVDSIFA
jgi:Uma2 family endonuclease